MTDLTWIKSNASVMVNGFGIVTRLAPIRINPEVYRAINEMAGVGDELWWRHEDWFKGPPESNWGWCFSTPRNEDEYAKWRMGKIDWEIDLWFREPSKAALVKLWLPSPKSA